jgi:hypothetical protein
MPLFSILHLLDSLLNPIGLFSTAAPSFALPLPIVIGIGHYCQMPPNIISATTSSMDSTITYDTVKALVANPPSLGDCPNFFNL